MKMSKPGLCCDDCFALIARRSSGAASLWLNLCEIQLGHEIFGLKLPDLPEFQILENLGFVTTTETNDMILMKVHGKRDDLAGTYFCGGKCGQ